MRRRGAPVARAVVGTAVIAGTAGAVHHRQNQRWAGQEAQQQAAADNAAMQQQVAYQQQQLDTLQQQQAMAAQAAPPPPAPAPAAAPAPDLMAQLNQLAAMHTAGVLSDAEFAAAKAKLLG
jgi:hypothetical protein